MKTGDFLKTRSGVFVPMSTMNGVYMSSRYFFWAEDGDLNMVDKVTGDFMAWPPRTAMLRVRKIAAGLGTSSNLGNVKDSQERDMMLRSLQRIEDLIKKANEQAAQKPSLWNHRRLLPA